MGMGNRLRRRAVTAAVIATLAAALVACGDDGPSKEDMSEDFGRQLRQNILRDGGQPPTTVECVSAFSALPPGKYVDQPFIRGCSGG